MKRLIYGGLFFLCAFQACAQIIFSTNHLPSTVGDYVRIFMNTNTVDVSAYTTAPGGPQYWDFSRPQTNGETIQRMDVVAPTDGGYATDFPQATYAHRFDANGSDAVIREYYSMEPGEGQVLHGFVDSSEKIFSSPVLDIPLPLQLGKTWSSATDFDDDIYGIYQVTLTEEATVDAYGTLRLPELGEVPALRISALHLYQHSIFGFPMYQYYARSYTWMVPGIGEAVEIISVSDIAEPPATNFVAAQRMFRVFDASGWPRPLVSVTGLNIRKDGTQVRLDWQHEAAAAEYRVEFVSELGTNAWTPISEAFTNFWMATMPTNQQGFYRVLHIP